MKIMYIGQCEDGSTSKMRYNQIAELLGSDIELINLSNVIFNTPWLIRSIGWRFKVGPMITIINNLINSKISLHQDLFDLIWIDKGVFITPSTMYILRYKTKKLVHFTPDPAFVYHRSHLFFKSLNLYDLCITTKSYELEDYKINCKKVILCTQAYDSIIHRPFCPYNLKQYDVCFIGHYEKNREHIIQQLLNNGISVVLAGIKWEKFVSFNSGNCNLTYLGNNLSGSMYAKTISHSRIGLGLLSKWIPEKHTTRTFEIPACGTALLTERNDELLEFFDEEEVIYFDSEEEILQKVKLALANPGNLMLTTNLGRKKVVSGNFSYQKIIHKILNEVF
jgi:spore maturation protein CgeB